MAFFSRQTSQEEPYTRHFPPIEEEDSGTEWPEEEEYDDGFDELLEEGEEDLPEDPVLEEELRQEKQRKFRFAAGLGNFGATLVGVALILVLIAFLIAMVQFISSDFSQNFSLLQTRF